MRAWAAQVPAVSKSSKAALCIMLGVLRGTLHPRLLTTHVHLLHPYESLLTTYLQVHGLLASSRDPTLTLTLTLNPNPNPNPPNQVHGLLASSRDLALEAFISLHPTLTPNP